MIGQLLEGGQREGLCACIYVHGISLCAHLCLHVCLYPGDILHAFMFITLMSFNLYMHVPCEQYVYRVFAMPSCVHVVHSVCLHTYTFCVHACGT